MMFPLRCLSVGMAFAAMVAVTPLAEAAGDLSGVWVVAGGGGGGSSAFDRNPESEWSTEKLPFTAQGRAAFDANRPGKGPRLQNNPQLRNDPLTQGNPPGLYRVLVYARPMQFVQAADWIVQLFSWSRAWRPIYIDGRAVPEAVAAGPFWYGYSVGRWDGDTLVVNTLALDSRAWFDEWGTPITDDARVEERWQRTAADTLQLRITVTDPALYTRPWTSMPIILKLQKRGTELEEIIHAPMDEDAFEQIITGPAGGPR